MAFVALRKVANGPGIPNPTAKSPYHRTAACWCTTPSGRLRAGKGGEVPGIGSSRRCVERAQCTSFPRDFWVGNPVIRIAEHLLIGSERSGPPTGKAAVDIQIGARHRLDREPPLELATYH